MKNVILTFMRALVSKVLRAKLRALFGMIYYFGFKYKCPFCRAHLRKFLPTGFSYSVLNEREVVGGGYRTTGFCPVCGSKDRDRLVYLFLQQKTDLFKSPQELLHIAPEVVISNKIWKYPSIKYLTADLNLNNSKIRMDITNIQFSENTFDSIICNHVLEHISEDTKAMSELYRVLRQKGWAILQVPISLSLDRTYEDYSIVSASDREKAFGQTDHVRIYAKDYKDRLEQVGFSVNIFRWITEADNFGGYENKFGLNKEEYIYFVTKNVN